MALNGISSNCISQNNSAPDGAPSNWFHGGFQRHSSRVSAHNDMSSDSAFNVVPSNSVTQHVAAYNGTPEEIQLVSQYWFLHLS